MKTFTVDDIMAYGPCYTRERVEKLFSGRESMTIREICAVDTPAKDRVWFLTRSDALDSDLWAQWTTIIVTRAITNHALHCGIPAVERWAENWLSGTNREADAADAAARAARAARAAYATYAARAAAYAADAADAADAAAYAADAAAYAVAYATAYAADAADAADAAADAARAARAAYAVARAAYAAARAAADAARASEHTQQIADLIGLLPE